MSDPTFADLVDEVTADLDPATAATMRSTMISIYKLGAATVRRQIMEHLTESHAQAEIEIADLRLEGLREN